MADLLNQVLERAVRRVIAASVPRPGAPDLHETGLPPLANSLDAPTWNPPRADFCTNEVQFGVSAKGDR
jgi:hypothetical protein